MTNYQLKELEDQRRLAEWFADPDMEGLDRDIAVARFGMEQSLQRGAHNQVLAYLSVLAKLLLTQKQTAVLNSHFISKRVLIELGNAITAAIVGELELALPDVEVREPVVDRIMARIFNSISAAKNEEQDVKLLKATQ